MSRPVRPNPAMLVVGILTARRDRFPAVAARLAERFGPIDLVGPWWPFDFTDYYEAEMGAPLHRRMMAFRPSPAWRGSSWPPTPSRRISSTEPGAEP